MRGPSCPSQVGVSLSGHWAWGIKGSHLRDSGTPPLKDKQTPQSHPLNSPSLGLCVCFQAPRSLTLPSDGQMKTPSAPEDPRRCGIIRNPTHHEEREGGSGHIREPAWAVLAGLPQERGLRCWT